MYNQQSLNHNIGQYHMLAYKSHLRKKPDWYPFPLRVLLIKI